MIIIKIIILQIIIIIIIMIIIIKIIMLIIIKIITKTIIIIIIIIIIVIIIIIIFIPIAIETMGQICSKHHLFYRSLVVAFQSQLVTHESLHSYSSDCLLLCNDTLQSVFVARLVLFKTMILTKRVWLLHISHHWYSNLRVGILISATIYCFVTYNEVCIHSWHIRCRAR